MKCSYPCFKKRYNLVFMSVLFKNRKIKTGKTNEDILGLVCLFRDDTDFNFYPKLLFNSNLLKKIKKIYILFKISFIPPIFTSASELKKAFKLDRRKEIKMSH